MKINFDPPRSSGHCRFRLVGRLIFHQMRYGQPCGRLATYQYSQRNLSNTKRNQPDRTSHCTVHDLFIADRSRTNYSWPEVSLFYYFVSGNSNSQTLSMDQVKTKYQFISHGRQSLNETGPCVPCPPSTRTWQIVTIELIYCLFWTQALITRREAAIAILGCALSVSR